MPLQGSFSSGGNQREAEELSVLREMVPMDRREGSLVVPTKKITGDEVNTIRDAVLHPKEKPDPLALVLSLSSSLIMAAKALFSAIKGPISPEDFVFFALGTTLSFGLIVRFVTQRQKKSPLHERALKNLNELYPPDSQLPPQAPIAAAALPAKSEKTE